MPDARAFDLGDILSVTTGKLVSPRHIAGVYEILEFLAGEAPYTHQLPRFMRECQPHVLRQHPVLADVTGEEVTDNNWRAWMAMQRARFGDSLSLVPIPRDDHARRNPLTELIERVSPERVIVVDPHA